MLKLVPILLAGLAASSHAFVPTASPLPAAWHVRELHARDQAWTAHVDPGSQVFPSMVIAMSGAKSEQPDPDLLTDEEAKIEEAASEQTLGDPDGWLYVMLKSPKANTKIRVTIECPEIMDPSTFKGTMTKEGATYGIAPKIRWKYKDLAKVRQPLPINVVFKVKVGDAEEEEDLVVCTLHTINDCPYLHLDHDKEKDEITAHNLAFLFAAYVNEDHPWVDQILKQALESRTVENFLGYQADSEDEVFKQVYAVWNVLQQRGITYSDITKISTRSQKVPSQHVRFLDESFAMKQANCVDGSVLMASVLRKIGIDVFLMLTPNHCYIGFYTDKDRKQMAGLETTMLGQAKKDEFERTKKLRELLDDNKTFDEASFESFQASLAVGTKALDEDIKKMTSGEFQYLQVSIRDARDQGIKAIPYFPPEKKDGLPGASPELTPEQKAEEQKKLEEQRKKELHDELEKLRIPEDKTAKSKK